MRCSWTPPTSSASSAGASISSAALQKSAGLADRIGVEARKLEHDSFTPNHGRTPRALRRSVAPYCLADVAAETVHERVEYRGARPALGIFEGREQQLLHQGQLPGIVVEVQIPVPFGGAPERLGAGPGVLQIVVWD